MLHIFKRKSVWVAATSLLVVPFIACIVLHPPWASRITRANLLRIQPGMTRPEVDAILGRPVGPGMAMRIDGFDDKPWEFVMYHYAEPEGFHDEEDGGFIVVDFDLDGKVETAQWCRGPELRLERSLSQRIRDRVRLGLYRMGMTR
jgi:outer membrane protein assembly factor BamE (lipoprotein component of BamABCDE complex)